jgi:hypothetical protein
VIPRYLGTTLALVAAGAVLITWGAPTWPVDWKRGLEGPPFPPSARRARGNPGPVSTPGALLETGSSERLPSGPGRPSSMVPSPAPTARGVLEKAAALGLRPDQRARLEALDRSWRRETAPVEAELEAAQAEFARFMREAQGRGATLAGVGQQAAPAVELGRQMRERRRAHVAAVISVLDGTQLEALARAATGVETGGGR